MARTITVGNMVNELNANRNQRVEYKALPRKQANPKGGFLDSGPKEEDKYGVFVNGTQVGVTNRRDIPSGRRAELDAKSPEPEVTVGPTTTAPVGSGAPRKVGGELLGTTLPLRDALAALRSGTGGAFPEDAVRYSLHAKGPMDEDQMRMNAKRLGLSEQQIASFAEANWQAEDDMRYNALREQYQPYTFRADSGKAYPADDLDRREVAMPAERMTPRMTDLIQGAIGNRLGDSDRDRAAQIYRIAEDIGRRESGGRQDWIGRGEAILRAQDHGQLKDLRPEDVGLTGGLARGGGNLDYLRMLKQINDKEIESNVSRHQSAMEAFADAPYGGKRVAKFREGLEDRRAAAIAASEAAGRRGLGDPRGKRFEHEQEMAMIESFNPTEFVKHAAELGQHFADEKIAGMYHTMLQGVNQLTQDMWAAKARGESPKELVGRLHNIRGARQKMIAWALQRLPQGSGKWDSLIARMQEQQEGPDPRL